MQGRGRNSLSEIEALPLLRRARRSLLVVGPLSAPAQQPERVRRVNGRSPVLFWYDLFCTDSLPGIRDERTFVAWPGEELRAYICRVPSAGRTETNAGGSRPPASQAPHYCGRSVAPARQPNEANRAGHRGGRHHRTFKAARENEGRDLRPPQLAEIPRPFATAGQSEQFCSDKRLSPCLGCWNQVIE